MLLAQTPVDDDVIDDLLLIVIIFLGDQYVLRAVRDAAPKRDIACVASHDLDDTASLMGRRCILYLVDRFHGCVDSRIKTDRVICTGDVKIDRSGRSFRAVRSY